MVKSFIWHFNYRYVNYNMVWYIFYESKLENNGFRERFIRKSAQTNFLFLFLCYSSIIDNRRWIRLLQEFFIIFLSKWMIRWIKIMTFLFRYFLQYFISKMVTTFFSNQLLNMFKSLIDAPLWIWNGKNYVYFFYLQCGKFSYQINA